MNKLRKAIIDDGMNPELVQGADFDGFCGIPIIKKPEEIVIPSGITPFSKIRCIPPGKEAVGFFEMDRQFSEILIHSKAFVETFRGKIIISPDCSLYRDAPLAVQIANVYRNRAIGSYYQRNGAYVIPNVRWGNSLTYTTDVLPEKLAFLGVDKHSIVAVGTYGCCQSKEDKYHFAAGFAAMMEELQPKVVLVYGPANKKIFEKYEKVTQIVQYDDWITRMKKGVVTNG